jgi:hypothetical protein
MAITVVELVYGQRNRSASARSRYITEKLYGGAPRHLTQPQISELEKLSLNQLIMLAEIDQFPIPEQLRAKLISELGSEEILKRMEKRWRIASAVQDAESKGLYEAAEHATGML